jgi:hypothetical protein
MKEVTREQRDKVINTAHKVAQSVAQHIAPMTFEYGPTETILGLMLACKQMETFFKWSFPHGREGITVMQELAEELNDVDMQIYKEELRASPLGMDMQKLMEMVGIKDKL